MVASIPEGLENRIVPYLMIDGASAAIDFYSAAFGAIEKYRLEMPNGQIGHAEIEVNGAAVYMADAPDGMANAPDGMAGDLANPRSLGGTSVLLHQYVDDVDGHVDRAVAAGAKLLREPTDQFYGDRAAVVEDPFGHQWSLHTHIRDVTPEEMAAAAVAMGST
jgi:PhnB protein